MKKSVGIYQKIIGKIKRLFKNLFRIKKRDKMLFLPEGTQNQKIIIKEEIIIPLDQERERIKKLQRKFQNKEIQEQEISTEDLEKLKKLYNTQIRDLKNLEIISKMKCLMLL